MTEGGERRSRSTCVFSHLPRERRSFPFLPFFTDLHSVFLPNREGEGALFPCFSPSLRVSMFPCFFLLNRRGRSLCDF